MIDGMMNNAPSMEELEARAKAGEQISLLDVAEAAKAEAQKAQADPQDDAETKETVHPGAACRRQGGTEKDTGAGKIKRNGGMRRCISPWKKKT